MDSLTPAQRAREEAGDEDDDEDYMPGPDVKKRLFDADAETPLRTAIKQPVLVYLRVRPKSTQELKEQDFFQVVEDNVVLTTSIRDGSRERFVFTNVFQPTASQKDVFNKTVVPILKDFFDGQNCLLFTYGITNSGKTHTIMGTSADPGVLPRALDVIFNSIEKGKMCEVSMKPKHFSEVRTLSSSDQAKEQEAKDRIMAQAKQLRSHQPEVNSSVVMDDDTSNTSKASLISNFSDVTGELFGLEGYQIHEMSSMEVPNSENCYFSIWISFVEIYNEIIADLLAGGATVKLKEDKHKNFFIDGTREIRVDSVEEALLLLKLGLKHRHVAGTKLNYQSSRSHSIYTIKCIRTVIDKPSHAMVNRISIIDLAGTERSAKTGAKGQRVKEAGKINQSLMVLGRCITAMRQNQTSRTGEEQLIPYRESRLTQLFQNYLVGKGKRVKQGKISMIINVSNNVSVYDETMHVLKFSALTSKVVPLAKPEQRVCADKSSEVEAENTLVPRPSEEGTGDMTDGRREAREVATVARLTKCTCDVDLDAYKSFIQQLQVELIEQEAKIRAEVSQEFHQQLTEIEDNHSKEMEDQQLELTSMYEGRIKKLNETTKKMKGQKRRRPNDDDDDIEHTSSEENVRALKREMELERCKAVSELKDLTETYESHIVRLNEQLNAASLKLLSSERSYESVKQQCEALRLENERHKRTYNELRQEYMCLRQESECHSEVTIQDSKTQCEALRQEAQDSKTQCEALRQEVQDSKTQCEALRLEAQDSKTQCEALRLEAQDSKTQCEALRLEAQDSKTQCEALRQEVQDSKTQCEALRQEVQDSKTQCEALRLEAQDSKTQCEALRLEVQDSKTRCEELKEEIRSKEEQISQKLMAHHQRELQAIAEKHAEEMAGQREECQVEEDLLQARISELMEELQGRRKSRGSLITVNEMSMVGQEVPALLANKMRLSAEVESLESEKESKSKLVEEIESLLREKNRLSAEVERLESEKESKSKLVEEIESLLREKNRLSAEVERLESEKESKSKLVEEIESLLREKNRLSAEVERLESEKESKSKLVEEIESLLREKNRLSAEVERLESEKESKSKLVEEIESLLREKNRLSAEVERLESEKESKSKLVEEIESLLREKNRLSAEVERLESEKESKSKLVEEIESLLREKNRLSAEVERLESEKESKSKLVEEIESLLREKNRLSAEVERLESEKESKSKLVEEIESLLREKNRLSAEVERLESEKESKSKLVEEIESLLREKNRLSAEVERLESEKESKSKLVEEIESLLREKNRLSAEVEGLKADKESKMAGLREQLLVCTSEISALQNDLRQERMERVKLQAEKDARIKEAAELRVLIDQRTEEMCSLRAQMDDLESKNAELSGGLKESFSSTFDEMNGTLQRQRDRIAELTNDIEKYKSENEELTESSIELQMQVQRVTTSRDSYASQLDELTKEYEDLKRSTSQRESKLLDTIDQTNSMMDEQAADLKKRCATWEHEFAVSKETNCELQLCVRKKDEDLLEAQKQLSRLQVEFLGTSQAQATRIEELTSCCGVIEAERDTLQDELRKERERHQAELESIQGNHQLEKARLVIRVRDLEAMEVAKKDQVLRDLEASEAKKDQVLRDLEASEAKKTKADKKTKALLASVQKEAEDLRGQVGTLKCELARLKEQKDELSSALAEMKEKMESKIASLNQERDLVLQEKVAYDVELQKIREQLKAEVKEREWLKAELQKKSEQVETIKIERLRDTPSQLHTARAESCSHDDLDSSKPHLPLLENSQLLESFVDPVKEERVEVALLMTPVATKKGRCGRKRKASPPVKPAADSVPQEESPVKRPRSRRKLPTTALQQQDENVELPAVAEVSQPSSTYSKMKEHLADLLPSKPARNTRRTKLLKSQISGPLEIVHDAIGDTPVTNKGKFILGRELRSLRTLRGSII